MGAQSLLAAMEQGEVSVAKGGTVAAMPARASVLAAANPVGGTYNRAQTVLENLNMPGPLLSRFDLVCAAPLPSSCSQRSASCMCVLGPSGNSLTQLALR